MIAVPEIKDFNQVRAFLNLLVERIDLLFGFRGNSKLASSAEVTEAIANLTTVIQSSVDEYVSGQRINLLDEVQLIEAVTSGTFWSPDIWQDNLWEPTLWGTKSTDNVQSLTESVETIILTINDLIRALRLVRIVE